MAIHIQAVRFNAGNDPDGTPRRGWQVSAGPDASRLTLVGFIREDNSGDDPLFRFIRGIDDATYSIVDTYPARLPVAEFRRMCRFPVFPPDVPDGGEIVTIAAVGAYGIRGWYRALDRDVRGPYDAIAVGDERERLTQGQALKILSRGGVVVGDAWSPSIRVQSGGVVAKRRNILLTRV